MGVIWEEESHCWLASSGRQCQYVSVSASTTHSSQIDTMKETLFACFPARTSHRESMFRKCSRGEGSNRVKSLESLLVFARAKSCHQNGSWSHERLLPRKTRVLLLL